MDDFDLKAIVCECIVEENLCSDMIQEMLIPAVQEYVLEYYGIELTDNQRCDIENFCEEIKEHILDI